MLTTACAHCAPQLVSSQTLNDRIGDFAALVGLVLVLVTLFTQQRSGKLQQLRGGIPDKRDWTTEIFLNVVLVFVTAGLFLAGLPIVIDCVKSLHPLRDMGPLRVAFTMVWALLIALIAWQVSLARAACGERKKWVKQHESTSPAPTTDDTG